MASQIPKPIQASSSTSEPTEQMAAYETTQAARDALEPEDIVWIFADVHTAASRAIAGAERAAPFAAEIEALPNGKGLLADVKCHALAAAHAQYLFLTTVVPAEEVDAMVEQLREKRETLYGDASALVKRKLLAKEAITHFSNSSGHRAITYDVGILCTALRHAWPQIEGKSAVTMGELVETQNLAEKAGRIITLKEMGDRTQVETKDQRNRAFTLMADSHDEMRRALGFIRYHEKDTDEIAPSLAAHRSKGRKPADASPAAPGTETPGTVSAPNAPAAPRPSNGAGAAPSAPTVNPGKPSAKPFIDD